MRNRVVAEITVRFINPEGIKPETPEMNEFLQRIRLSHPAYSSMGRTEELTIRREGYSEHWVDDPSDDQYGGHWERSPWAPPSAGEGA